MAYEFFLGATSGEGFVSLLPDFQREEDRRIYALKGGPGCGKSTCIRRLAEALGGAEEVLLCSSDPDSLDGAVVPGAALLDATAPHVFEPVFPGCDGDYLELPSLLDQEGLAAQRPALYALKAAAGQHYARAWRLLKAAALLREDRRERLRAALLRDPECRLRPLLREIPRAEGPGRLRRRFLEGCTPKGHLCLWATVETHFPRVIALEDPCGLAEGLLQRLMQEGLERGQTVYGCYDPLEPRRLRHLLLPDCGLAFVSGPTPFSPARRVHLEGLLDREKLAGQRGLLRLKQRTEDGLLEDAVAEIAAAHGLHDRIEALYRPHLDLAALDSHCARLLERIRGDKALR